MTMAEQTSRRFGRDIWFDLTSGDANLEVTAAGDWAVVEGRAALRQALIRRILTSPGEWQTLPDYGVGARTFVKSRDTPAAREELEERIRAQFAQETRVRSVEQVLVERLGDGLLRVSVTVIPAGEAFRRQPLIASVEVQ